MFFKKLREIGSKKNEKTVLDKITRIGNVETREFKFKDSGKKAYTRRYVWNMGKDGQFGLSQPY